MNANSMVENVTRIKSRIKINVDVSAKIKKKKHYVCKKDYIWNPATYTCKNELVNI